MIRDRVVQNYQENAIGGAVKNYNVIKKKLKVVKKHAATSNSKNIVLTSKFEALCY